MIRLSIVIPTFGRPDKLLKLLTSIPCNTEVEIIVVDDNGLNTENQKLTKQKLESIPYRNITYKALITNSGASIARNEGVEISSGRLVTFLDDDDLLLYSALLKKVDFFEKNFDNYDIVCNDMLIKHEGEIPEKRLRPSRRFIGQDALTFLTSGVCYSPMIMIKKSKYIELNGFPKVSFFQDHNFMLNAHLKNCRVGVFTSPTFYHVTHLGPRISKNKRSNFDGIELRIAQENMLAEKLGIKGKLLSKIKYSQSKFVVLLNLKNVSRFIDLLKAWYLYNFKKVYSFRSFCHSIYYLYFLILDIKK
ncbi:MULTISPECIES: glycosyltransferase family 2 protein [unclassified Pseudoalteromonas]|uniref:glycosyltransferase family 2 protein n=1 Tax=unclassified Pseudoalteromonas TaxID=194690 RepID=UPI0004057D11|nr:MULTISPECIES: glycosyltransferase [unclassified Pseudoalteromonas]